MQEGIGCCGEVQIQTKSAGRRRRHSQYVTTFNQADVTIMIISRTTIEKLKSKTKKQQQSSWRTQESLLRAVKGTAVQCTNALQAGRRACLTMLVCKAVNPTVSPTNWPLFKWTRKVIAVISIPQIRTKALPKMKLSSDAVHRKITVQRFWTSHSIEREKLYVPVF